MLFAVASALGKMTPSAKKSSAANKKARKKRNGFELLVRFSIF